MDDYPRACPRCGEALDDKKVLGVFPLQQAEGFAQAWQLRHLRDDGRPCVAFLGPRIARGADTAKAGR